MIRRKKVTALAETPRGLITSDAVRNHGAMRAYKKFWAIGAVALAAILAAGAFYLMQTELLTRKASPVQSTSSDIGLLAANPKQAVQTAQVQVKAAHSASAKAAAYENLGTAYLNNHQYTLSIAAYKQSLTYDPADTIKLTELSSAYGQAGQKSQAIATLQQIVAILQKSSNSADKESIPYYQSLLRVTQEGNK